MKEGISARVGRILSGSVNSLLDAMENMAPETVMEQVVREVDGAIDEVRAELGKVAANKHLASRRLMDANKRHEDLVEKIDLAVREGRDDLAEAAVSRQLDIEAQVPVLETAIADAVEEEKRLEGMVHALQARRREMHQELREFRQSRQAAAGSSSGSGGGTGSGASGGSAEQRAAKAVAAFDRIQERQTGLASADGSLTDAGKLAELEDLARKNRIQERLAAAKARSSAGKE